MRSEYRGVRVVGVELIRGRVGSGAVRGSWG